MKKEQYVNYFTGRYHISVEDATKLFVLIKKQWGYVPEFSNYINSNKQLRYYSKTVCLSMDYSDAVEVYQNEREAKLCLLNGKSVFDNSGSLKNHLYKLPSGMVAVIYDR